MKTNFFEYKEKFKNDGYFVIKNFVDKNFIYKLIEEINNSKNTDKYYDSANNLRRIEKLFNKGQYLINLNKKISIILKDILDKDFLIFKDKFNSKPPGGEGFLPITTVYFNLLILIIKRKKVGTNMETFLLVR